MIDAIMHEYKHGAAEVIASAWPGESMRRKDINSLFQKKMYGLQRALLECHRPYMDQKSATRCLRTLECLDAIARGEEIFWNG